MATVAEKVEQLPEPLRYKIEGYIDAMTEIAAEARRQFLKEFDRAAASPSISDEEFRARLQAKYGPLDLGD